MSRPSVHILYEYGADFRPHGSAYIRLLRPLTHPTLSKALKVTCGLLYKGQAADGVIVDRLWRPDISVTMAEGLVEDIRRAGARFIYAVDDNLLDLPSRRLDLVSKSVYWPTEEHRQIVEFFLWQADGVLVTTPALRERFMDLNPRIKVVPNALDEQLLVGGRHSSVESPFGRAGRTVIGYMGTLTHDDDLTMVLPALQSVTERHRGDVEFQIVGGIGRAETFECLEGLPVRMVEPRPEEREYPLFMLWFSSRLRWDIAIAPLKDTPFSKGKSDVKFLDYGAIGAAGIYSRVPAYESSVRHLETGLLVSNETDAWIEALDTLIRDDALRVQLARNAERYLYTERVLAHCASDWLNAIESLVNDSSLSAGA